jgi:hypothetical protein
MEMEVAAWLASTLVFTSFFMKTMVPLRIVAIASNIAFIVYALLGARYGIFEKVLPILVLHSMLLPLNLFRVHEAALDKIRFHGRSTTREAERRYPRTTLAVRSVMAARRVHRHAGRLCD